MLFTSRLSVSSKGFLVTLAGDARKHHRERTSMASLRQVCIGSVNCHAMMYDHIAWLKDGRDLAVKIIRREIHDPLRKSQDL
jgi:hypothetical protein